MNLNLKIISIIAVVIILIISIFSYIIIDNGAVENKTLNIETITGDTSGQIGDIITINVSFSEENVIDATLFYKNANETNWNSISILKKNCDIILDSNEEIYYYAIITDSDGKIVGDPSIDGSIFYTITVIEDDEDNTEYKHTVLIEEGSFTSCYYCPQVANTLYELYSSGLYNFYYITLIKANELAAIRLDNEYNIYGLPTVFIDGGFEVIVGGLNEKSDYAKAIRNAEKRPVSKIQISVNAEFDNITNNLISNVQLDNFENEIYSGKLKVYLTEKISRWSGPGGEPYHFGFLEYLTNTEFSLDSKGSRIFTEKRNISDLDPENLMVIAAVFNSEKKQEYSNPAENTNPFDAYYADAVDGSELMEGGNLPPTVGFNLPEIGKVHILGKPIFKTPFKKTILIGRTKIVAGAYDDSGLEKVEFYINDNLVGEDTEPPYEYSFRKVNLFKHIIGKHTISCIAYDDEGKTGVNSIDIISLFL